MTKDLIPIAYLNEACFMSLNTDDKKYRMCLKISQDELKDLLGAEFYEEMYTQITGNSLSTDNDVLYESYIKDYLAWQTYFNYIKFANVDATPTGIRVHRDDNSELANSLQLHSVEKNIQERAVWYRNQLINYLTLEQEKDSTKFPLYDGGCNEEGSFMISKIEKSSNAVRDINRRIITNE